MFYSNFRVAYLKLHSSVDIQETFPTSPHVFSPSRSSFILRKPFTSSLCPNIYVRAPCFLGFFFPTIRGALGT